MLEIVGRRRREQFFNLFFLLEHGEQLLQHVDVLIGIFEGQHKDHRDGNRIVSIFHTVEVNRLRQATDGNAVFGDIPFRRGVGNGNPLLRSLQACGKLNFSGQYGIDVLVIDVPALF